MRQSQSNYAKQLSIFALFQRTKSLAHLLQWIRPTGVIWLPNLWLRRVNGELLKLLGLIVGLSLKLTRLRTVRPQTEPTT